MMELKKFIVQKSKWLRGEGPSRLPRSCDNKMCCLGFVSLACGLERDDILDVSLPSGVYSN